MKIFIGERFGCDLNYQDIYICSQLVSKYDITKNISEADIIVFPSSCSCTESRINSTIKYIYYWVRQKKPTAKVYLTGCLTRKLKFKEQQDWLDNFFAQYIDCVIPQNNPNMLLQKISEDFHDLPIDDFGCYIPHKILNKVQVYIGNGCLNNCAFCKTSYQNYPLKSTSMEYAKEAIDAANESGLSVLELIATNICETGLDLYGEPMLPELISYVEAKDNITKLNLIGVAFKDAIKYHLAEPFSESTKIDYISGSVETGSPRLLEMIRKGFTPEEIIEFMNIINKNQRVRLDTNIISGLPTETIDDVEATLRLLKEIKPYSVNISEYLKSSFLVHLNSFPQLSDEEIRSHTKIYEQALTRERVLKKVILKK